MAGGGECELCIGFRYGDMDPQPAGKAVRPPPAEEPVSHLEVQTDQPKDSAPHLSGKQYKYKALNTILKGLKNLTKLQSFFEMFVFCGLYNITKCSAFNSASNGSNR